MLIFLVNSPSPNNFTSNLFLEITLFSSNTSLLISTIHFVANFSRSDKLITLKCFLNLKLEKPFNFGNLLNKGVCPHSNQSGTQPPDLQFCPFIPLPQNVQ